MANNKENDRQTRTSYEKVIDHFKGDVDKANEWFHEPKRELHGRSPMNMIGNMRARDLNRFIDERLRNK